MATNTSTTTIIKDFKHNLEVISTVYPREHQNYTKDNPQAILENNSFLHKMNILTSPKYISALIQGYVN